MQVIDLALDLRVSPDGLVLLLRELGILPPGHQEGSLRQVDLLIGPAHLGNEALPDRSVFGGCSHRVPGLFPYLEKLGDLDCFS